MPAEVNPGLLNARSAYLRSARQQPVRWREWSPEAFALAAREDKPILLDIGAVWCHWCHVMDRESYENDETAALINQYFIPIKVDRDERPDVDARYQAAVAAISGQGGWPVTALLTPDGRPFFGGTYFPPTDQHGRPGLRRVLATMAEAYRDRREEVLDSAASVMAAIEANETFEATIGEDGAQPVDPASFAMNPEGDLLFPTLLAKITVHALSQFDPRNGGFGGQPKFPNSAALDLLLDTGARPNSPYAEQSRHTVLFSLEKMSKGGIYDHLAGGFHRYSTDERWIVPHFEKMSYDNSELLRNYVHAYQSTGEQECGRVSRETIRWIDSEMSDRELGGFYSSQDADESLDDDGDYFTWTCNEALAVLTPEEMSIVEPFFDLGPLGDMHHNVEKNVLHIDRPLPQLAQSAGLTLEQAAGLVARAKVKLYAARQLRPTPIIDRTLYTGWNAMMITAYLEAGRVLTLPHTTAFALKTLDRILVHAGLPQDDRSEAKVILGEIIPQRLPASTSKGGVSAAEAEDPTLPHVVAYGETTIPGTQISGFLDDYVFTAHAALDAWQSTGRYFYYQAAVTLTQAILNKFYDPTQGGFFDTENAIAPVLGALSARRKPLQDAPTPAGNPVTASLLLRLYELNGEERYHQIARQTLQLFSAAVEHFGLYAAAYGQALTRFIYPHTQIVIVGDDPLAAALEQAALRPYRLTQSVIRLRAVPAQLPPALAQLPQLGTSYALLCSNQTCQPPIHTPQTLIQALQKAAASKSVQP